MWQLLTDRIFFIKDLLELFDVNNFFSSSVFSNLLFEALLKNSSNEQTKVQLNNENICSLAIYWLKWWEGGNLSFEMDLVHRRGTALSKGRAAFTSWTSRPTVTTQFGFTSGFCTGIFLASVLFFIWLCSL